MKILDIRELYSVKYREYIVDSSTTGRHGVYLVYGEAAKNEQREMSPGGHDEILFLLEGDAVLEYYGKKVDLKKEHAVSLDPEGSIKFLALEDCRYVVAGTHIVPHEH
jgi:hypothetical protein